MDQEIGEQLAAIEASLDRNLEVARLLLALRLEQDGHVPNLGAGLRLAEDIEAVKKLYPLEGDEE